MELFLYGGIGLAVLLLFLITVMRSFIYIGRPNEVLIFSGRDHRLPSGETVGYRYEQGGLNFKTPIVEKVDRMDLRVMPVHIHIEGAYSQNGIPLRVHAIANVKVASDEARIHNAIERFQGRERSEIHRVAKETLEGNLRDVLATLTPEQVNEDRIEFVKRVDRNAKSDLAKLGLHLDTLKIQSVSDDEGYLDDISRKTIAEVIKSAEIVESDAIKASEEVESEQQGLGEVKRREAQAQIQQAQNALRKLQADLELQAKSEEERAEAAALEARAIEEEKLQEIRARLEEIRLKSDVVLPAEAEARSRRLIAAGEAAESAEQGRAMALVLSEMAQVWREAGDLAGDIFIIQRLESIMGQLAATAKEVKVREVALIDGGSGVSLPNYVSSYPKIVANLFAELRDTVGLDIGGALTGRSGDDSEWVDVTVSDVDDDWAGALDEEPERPALTDQRAASSLPQQGLRSLSEAQPVQAQKRNPNLDVTQQTGPTSTFGGLRPRRNNDDNDASS